MKVSFAYFGIRVRDLDRSVNFYRKALGMKVVKKGVMPHGGRYVGLNCPGSESELELNWYPKGNSFYTPFKKGDELDHLAIRVGKGNIETAFKELVKRGAKVAVAPKDAEGLMTEVYVKDPDGNWIEILG